MTTTAPEITWKRGRHCGAFGFVHGVHLFTIGYHSRDQWNVQSTLPGIKKGITAESSDAAKARCERILAAWAKKMFGLDLTAAEPATATTNGAGQ